MFHQLSFLIRTQNRAALRPRPRKCWAWALLSLFLLPRRNARKALQMQSNGSFTMLYDLRNMLQVSRASILRDWFRIPNPMGDVASDCDELVQSFFSFDGRHFFPSPVAAELVQPNHVLVEIVYLSGFRRIEFF